MASAWGLAWGKSWGKSWGKLDDSYLQFPVPTGGSDYYERLLEARTRWIRSERRRLGLLPPEARETFLAKVDKQSLQLAPAEVKAYTQKQDWTAQLLARALEMQLSYQALLRLDLLQQRLLEQQLIEERDIMFLLAVLSEL